MKWTRLVGKLPASCLSDEALEALTLTGLSCTSHRALEQHLRLRATQAWGALRDSVDGYIRTLVGNETTQDMEVDAVRLEAQSGK